MITFASELRSFEVGVVATRLTGERDVQRVVEVVAPLRVDAVAAVVAQV